MSREHQKIRWINWALRQTPEISPDRENAHHGDVERAIEVEVSDLHMRLDRGDVWTIWIRGGITH